MMMLSIAGQLVSGIFSMAQGNAQARAIMEADAHNRALAERRAQEALYNKEFEAQNIRQQYRKLRAQQTAGYLAAGVTMEGTPLAMLAETAKQEERDVFAVQLEGARTASGLRAQADVDSIYARGQANVARSKGFGSMLGAAFNVGGNIPRTLAGGGASVGLSYPSGSFR